MLIFEDMIWDFGTNSSNSPGLSL